MERAEAGAGGHKEGLLRGTIKGGRWTARAILLPMNNTILAVLLIGICQVVAFGGFCYLLKGYLTRRIQRAQERINAELLALVEQKPCKSASVLNAVGHIIGQEAGRTAKASFMADLAHTKRAANIAGEEALVDAVGEKQPLLGAVLGGMGRNKRKGLFDNPLVQGLLSQFIGGGSQPSNHEDRSKSGPSSFSM